MPFLWTSCLLETIQIRCKAILYPPIHPPKLLNMLYDHYSYLPKHELSLMWYKFYLRWRFLHDGGWSFQKNSPYIFFCSNGKNSYVWHEAVVGSFQSIISIIVRWNNSFHTLFIFVTRLRLYDNAFNIIHNYVYLKGRVQLTV